MDKKNLKILVIGAGCIGGITAAHMSRSGYHVEVVDKLPGLAEKINTQGIQVSGVNGKFQAQMKTYADIKEVVEKKDIILIATKANALDAVVSSMKQVVKESSVIVSLQNGICETYLAKAFGFHRVIGCVVGWGATVHEPGKLEMTSKGEFIIGKISEQPPDHLDFVEDILKKTAPVQRTNNIYGHLYSKLIINSCVTTLGALCGKTLGTMLGQRKVRNIFIDIINEAVTVGKSLGISIEKFARKLDFYSFAEKNNWFANLKKHLLILLLGFKYRRLKSSSLQSLELGQKTEIDFLNGYIAGKARDLGIQTPLNNILIHMIKEIETGKRKISINNFDMPFFDKY